MLPEHLQALFKKTCSNLSKQQSKIVKSLLGRHANLFTKSDDDLGRTGLAKHTIDTGENKPIREKC